MKKNFASHTALLGKELTPENSMEQALRSSGGRSRAVPHCRFSIGRSTKRNIKLRQAEGSFENHVADEEARHLKKTHPI
jgi:hypothetical protein